MRKLILHKLARKDLSSIREYSINNWGKKQAIKYMKELRQSIYAILENPHVGTNRIDINEKTYSFVYKKHMFYYQFNHEKLVIGAVLHHSQLPTKHLKDRI